MTEPEPEGLWIDCVTCGGQGRIHHHHDGHWWTTPCPTCNGVGSDYRTTNQRKHTSDGSGRHGTTNECQHQPPQKPGA